MYRLILYAVLFANLAAHVDGATRYVSHFGHHEWPYTNWVSAATNIAAAVHASGNGDNIVVSNGVYHVTAQIVVTNGVWIAGLGEPSDTVVNGSLTTRVFWVDHPQAKLSHMTIEQGVADGDGGGVWIGNGAVAEWCVFRDNATTEGGDGGGVFVYNGSIIRDCISVNNYSADDGGGVQLERDGIAERCWIADNVAADKGGAAVCRHGGILRNCVMVGNTAHCSVGDPVGLGLSGGAVYGRDGTILIEHCTITSNASPGWVGGVSFISGSVTIRNSILYDNAGGNYDARMAITIVNSCTIPLPPGASNIALNPEFVGTNVRNYQLMYGSPCIDAGSMLATVTNDIRHVMRPVDGNRDGMEAHDMGAYEYDPIISDSNGDTVPDWWYLQYRLDPNTNGIAFDDTDADGLTNIAEFIADTNPTNPASFFPPLLLDTLPTGLVLTIDPSSANRLYHIDSRTNLLGTGWTPATNAPGTGGPWTYEIPLIGDGPRFYRSRVTLP